MKKCCFAEHSKIYTNKDLLYGMVKNKSEELITEKGIKEFWAGNYGAFDHIAAPALRELKKKYLDISLILVIPYLTNKINKYKEQYYKDYETMIRQLFQTYLKKRRKNTI